MIEIKTLVKTFGPVTALSGISFQVPTGSIFGLVGSNGAGKSTLLRVLSGVYMPEQGTALFDGTPSYEQPLVKDRIFFISDFPYFPSNTTLEDLRSLMKDFYSRWDDNTFYKLCSMFPIDKNKKIKDMSKGMQRQAALIGALSTKPDYLLMDEIFDGLDPVVRQLLKRLVAGEVADRNMTVVIASHNLRELEDFCDTIALLHKGGVLLEQDLDSLKLGICRVQAIFQAPPAREIIGQKLDIVTYEQRGSLISFVARGKQEEIMVVLDSFSPTFRETLPLSLEEVFICEMEAAGYDIDNILS